MKGQPTVDPRAQPLNLSVDYEDLERHDLLSGEPRYVEDEIRNSTLGIAFGVLAFVFCVVAMILCWILYYRERTRTFLWHAIALIFLALFGLIIAGWGFMTGSALKTGKAPNAFLSGFVFICALMATIYLLVESIWFVLYRPVHFNYILGLSTDPNLWGQRMPNGYNFLDGWGTSRRIMWWTTFFTIAAALCFAFCAYAGRSVVWNKYQLTRLCLYIALLWAVISAWIVIYWVQEGYNYQAIAPNLISYNLLVLIKICAITALVLAFLNALINMIQSRIGYFLMAALEIILIVVLVCCVGSLLRTTGSQALTDIYDGDCLTTMKTIHENNINSWCISGGKYASSGTVCTKSYMTPRWEGNNELRALNPACCGISKFYYLYPMMLIGFWGLILIASLAVAVACNVYLAESNEYLHQANLGLGIIDYIGLAAIVIALIAFGIYFWARKKTTLEFPPNNVALAYNDPINNKIQGFDIVPKSVIAAATSNNTNSPVNPGAWIPFITAGGSNPQFSTSTSQTGCTDVTKCVKRVAILVQNGAARVPTSQNQANIPNQGTPLARNTFFPDCTSTNDDFLFYYGTPDQINFLMTGLKFSPVNNYSTSPTAAFIYTDQITNTSVLANGLLANESASAVAKASTPSDGPTCGNGYSTTQCSGNCKTVSYLNAGINAYTLKGRLYSLQNGQQNYSLPIGLTVAASDLSGTSLGNTFTTYANGLFSINNIPRYTYTGYPLRLTINDPTGVFLPKIVDVWVAKDNGNFNDISAGAIRLDTKDGKVCNFGDTTCINNQKQLYGNIIVGVVDSTNSSNQIVANGTTVELHQGFSQVTPTYQTSTTDANGNAQFTGVPYGPYTVVVGKSGYRYSASPVDLQQSSVTVPGQIIWSSPDQNDMRVSALINEPNVDFDLNLQVASDKGSSCVVNPVNKYCAYSSSLNDVASAVGTETIAVKRLSVANYNAYVAPSPAYSAVCANAANYNTNAGMYHAQGWNWDTYKQTQQLNTMNIFVSTIGSSFQNFKDGYGNVISFLSGYLPAETPDQAATLKNVLSVNGQAVTGQTAYTNFTKGTGASTNVNNVNTWYPGVVLPSSLASNTGSVAGSPINGTVISSVAPNSTTNATVSNFSTSQINFTNNTATDQSWNLLNVTNITFTNGTVYNYTSFNSTTYSTVKQAITVANLTGVNYTNFSSGQNYTWANTSNKTNTTSSVPQTWVVTINEISNFPTTANLPNTTAANTTITSIYPNGDYNLSSASNQTTAIFANGTTTILTTNVSYGQINADQTVSNVTVYNNHTTTIGKTFDYTVTTNVTRGYTNGSVITSVKIVNSSQVAPNAATGTTQKTVIELTSGNVTIVQSDVTTNTVARLRILESSAPAHEQGNTNLNYIWASCFSGFGDVSLIQLNTYTTNQPDVSQCNTLINSVTPQYNLASLRNAYNAVCNAPGATC